MTWRSTCSLEALQARAKLNQTIRDFFSERDVLEVETPLLGLEAVSDPYIDCFEVKNPITQVTEGYLQSSPEYYLKRLLASGSGDVYQLAKVFRANEQGSKHSIEFTMLEWYRIGLSLDELIQEVIDLIQSVGFSELAVHHFTFTELFQNYCNIDIQTCQLAEIQEKCLSFYSSAETLNFEECCDLLLTHVIEPEMENLGVVVVTGFLSSQAALAKIDVETNTALRFEVYLNGKELANGYDELLDGKELEKRTAMNNTLRREQNKPEIAAPKQLISAMKNMRDCVGVALGVDRLLMEVIKASSINQTLSFEAGK